MAMAVRILSIPFMIAPMVKMLLLRMRYTCAGKEYSPNGLLTMNRTIYFPAAFFNKECKFRWLRHIGVIDYVQES